MRDWLRDRMASEEGISLVELVVAIAILALILMGLAATLTSSLHALVANESRVSANALANDTLEELQSGPWDDLETGTETETGQGADGAYTVTTEIAWDEDTSVLGTEDYYEFTVTVDWDDLGTARSVTHDGRRSPPAADVDDQVTVRSARVDAEIGYLRRKVDDADVHGRLRQRVEFDDDGEPVASSLPSNEGVGMLVTTTAPVDEIEVTLVDRHDNTESGDMSLVDPADETEWELPGTVTNNWRYRNGDNTFVFTMTTDDGSTFTARKVVRYVFENVRTTEDDPTADPATVCVDDAGVGEEAVEVTAEVWGLTVDDRVLVSGAGLDEDQEWLAEHTETTNNGSVFAFVLPEGHAYPGTEQATVTMSGVRGFDGHTGDEDNPPDEDDVELVLLSPDDDDYDGECGP